MQEVALNWHVYILTGSPVALGLVSFSRFIPIFVFSLVGGVFADTHDRRRILLVTQSVMMLLAGILGLLTNLGWISTTLIYLISASSAGAISFDAPARQSLPPNLVPQEDLTNALSLNNMMRQIATVIGPMLAGFVIAWRGVAAVYWLNAASFLGVLIALAKMRTPTQKRLGAATVNLSALIDGIRYVRHSKIVLGTMLLDFLCSFFSSASALLPIFAQEILKVGPRGLGILYASEAAGAVVAGAGMSMARDIRRKAHVFLWAIGIYGAATIVYGLSHWIVLSVLALALVGTADTVSTILRNTLRQIVTPDHLRGRMTAVSMIFARGGPQLGNLEAGIVAALIGAPLSVITGGLATLVTVALVAWFAPQLRNYREN
jgi:MFS family permease